MRVRSGRTDSELGKTPHAQAIVQLTPAVLQRHLQGMREKLRRGGDQKSAGGDPAVRGSDSGGQRWEPDDRGETGWAPRDRRYSCSGGRAGGTGPPRTEGTCDRKPAVASFVRPRCPSETDVAFKRRTIIRRCNPDPLPDLSLDLKMSDCQGEPDGCAVRFFHSPVQRA